MAKSASITEAKDFKDLWAAIPFFVKVIIWIVILILLFLIGRAIYQEYKNRKKNKILNESFATVTYTGAGGQPIVQTVDLGTKAAVIDDAFYHNDWLGWTEDEDKAITELLGVQKELIPDLSGVYYKLNSKNLKEDFIQFTGDKYSKVAHLFQ